MEQLWQKVTAVIQIFKSYGYYTFNKFSPVTVQIWLRSSEV